MVSMYFELILSWALAILLIEEVIGEASELAITVVSFFVTASSSFLLVSIF